MLPDSVIYIRTSVEQGVGPGGLARPPITTSMIDDLKRLSSLSREAITSVIEQLAASSEIMSQSGVQSFVATAINDEQGAMALARLLWHFSTGSVRSMTDWTTAVTQWRDADAENKSRLTPDEQAAIDLLVPLLIQPLPPMRKWMKANRVATMTGVKLLAIQVVCDIRPVFNEPRDGIDAIIPSTTLKIIWEDEAGLPKAVEARLTPTQIEDFATKLEQARRKLATIDEFASTHHLPAFELSTTRRG
jgi:hypothetical protein